MRESPGAPPATAARYPPGIPYIVGNEAAERFSYYGMRAILFIYLVALYSNFVPEDQALPGEVKDAKVAATKVTHLFFAGAFAFPMMLIIPVLNIAVYRPLERRGIAIPPLRRMTAGMFLTALSFVAIALLERRITELSASGQKLSVAWQVIPYSFLTLGEVLVSVTGLEFAYTQAPRAMKSTIMGFWLLTVTMGNLLVALLAPFQKLSMERFFWTFAGLMAVATALFAVLARFYRGKTYLQDGAAH